MHFTIAVRDRHIRDMVCPVCCEPDINDQEQLDSYFSTLDIQVKVHGKWSSDRSVQASNLRLNMFKVALLKGLFYFSPVSSFGTASMPTSTSFSTKS